MVTVENALSMVQIEIVIRIFIPWQINHLLQVCKLSIIVGTLNMQLVQALHFFLKDTLRFLAPLLFLSLLTQSCLFRRTFLASQLLIDALELLTQEVFLLLHVYCMLGTIVDVDAKVCILYLPVHQRQKFETPQLQVVERQQAHLLCEFERHEVRHGIEQLHRTAHVFQCQLHLKGESISLLNIFTRLGVKVAQHCLELHILRSRFIFRSRNDVCPDIRFFLQHIRYAAAHQRVCKKGYPILLTGHLKHLYELAYDTILTKVLRGRIFY